MATSLPALSLSVGSSDEEIELEGFDHKRKKFRSASKTLTVMTPRGHSVSATHVCSPSKPIPLNDGQRFSNLSDYRLDNTYNQSTSKKPPRQSQQRSITDPNLANVEPVPLRDRPSRFKPSSSLELNLFQRKYKHSRLPVHSISTDPTAVGNHGYVLFKEKGKKQKKRWLNLTHTHLRCYRTVTAGKDSQVPVLEIPLEYAAVKQEKSNSFSVITPDTSYLFQSEWEKDISIWVGEITAVCNKLVLQSINSEDKSTTVISEAIIDTTGANNQEIWWMASASRCADCGDTNPEWASVNLGTFICVECSGVHRSFGTHISQVKAVRLDHWTPEQTIEMKQAGNKKSNKIWEYNIPENFERITSHTERPERVKWLTNKYVLGRFREDYVPTGPKMYSGKESTKEEIHSVMLEGLRNDEKFRSEMAALIFGL